MKHVVCFHLFNDYSGSPKVLKMVLEGLLKKGCRVDLVSSRGGVLDELNHSDMMVKHGYSYRFSQNGMATALRYCMIQLYTFLLAFRWIFRRDAVFYINTLLPIGPAMAGRMMGKRVVYHYHENAFAKGTFYKVLAWMMQRLANEIICVSDYQASFLKRKRNVTVIPNALSREFIMRLQPMTEDAFERKRVLMLGSLKLYKSPLEFIELSQRLRQYDFELVVNDTQENIDLFLKVHGIVCGKNLRIYPRQNDVVPFYNNASLVLNISNKKKILETFGLTALEAMAAGLPVIVPTEGGIAEMVEDGINGYKIDVQDLDRIAITIDRILSDKMLYLSLSKNAFEHSGYFKEEVMINAICNILMLKDNS